MCSQYRPWAVKRARTIVGYHGEDAEDLAQQTFINAWRSWHGFDGRNVTAWLGRIMVNLHINGRRRLQRFPPPLFMNDFDVPTDMRKFDGQDDQTPERVLDGETLSELPARALMRLNDKFRVAVVLSDLLCLDYEQIQDALEVPRGTVKSRIHRGRRRLRKYLAAFAREEMRIT